MAATFCFEHRFAAASPRALLALYFAPERVAAADLAAGVASREVLGLVDSGPTLRRVCRITPRRQLPAFVRPLFPTGLSYVEAATWTRAEDRIEVEIRPALLGGRAQITSTYSASADGTGAIRRIYAGSVSVEVPLVGRRIERGIVADLERSLAATAAALGAFLGTAGGPGGTGSDQRTAAGT